MKLKLIYNRKSGKYQLMDADTGDAVENLVALRFGYSAGIPVFEINMFLNREYLEIVEAGEEDGCDFAERIE